MPFSVYIIYSAKLNKYYVGHTENIEMRLSQHNSGFSSFTSKASDWQLKFAEEFSSRSLATLREKEIKAKKSRKYVEWLIECKGTKYWKMSVNPLILPTIQN